MQQREVTLFDDTAEGWERSLMAFLAEKDRRSGSRRTQLGWCPPLRCGLLRERASQHRQ